MRGTNVHVLTGFRFSSAYYPKITFQVGNWDSAELISSIITNNYIQSSVCIMCTMQSAGCAISVVQPADCVAIIVQIASQLIYEPLEINCALQYEDHKNALP